MKKKKEEKTRGNRSSNLFKIVSEISPDLTNQATNSSSDEISPQPSKNYNRRKGRYVRRMKAWFNKFKFLPESDTLDEIGYSECIQGSSIHRWWSHDLADCILSLSRDNFHLYTKQL